MIKYISVLLFLFAIPCLGQVEVATLVHRTKSNNPSLNNIPISDGFVLVSDTEKEFGVFLNFGNKIIAKGLDTSYNILGTLESRKITGKEKYIGGKAFGDAYYLFFKEKKSGKVNGIHFNFNTKEVEDFKVNLSFENETIFQTFEHQNVLYFLSIGTYKDNKNDLIIHSLDKNFETSREVIDLSNIKLLDYKNRSQYFQRIITQNKESITGIGLFPYQEKFPTTLPESTHLIKIYKDKEALTISFDINSFVTQLLTINIFSKDISFQEIKKSNLDQKVKQSNSFLLANQLFQIISKDKEVTVQVKDISNDSILYKHQIKNDMEFANTNTATLKLKPSRRVREEVTPKQFLKRAKKDPIGIYAIHTEDEIQITYGSWNQKKGNNRSLDNSKNGSSVSVPIATTGGAIMGGVMGGVILYAVMSNSGNSIQSYGMHHQGMTTRAIGVFDTDFNHIPDKGVKANIYHKIDYYNMKKKDTSPLLLFEFNNSILYGSFYPNQNAIVLLRFN